MSSTSLTTSEHLRELSVVRAVGLALGLALVGAVFDVLTGPGLRLVFALCFVVGCALAALLVRRRDLRTAVVMPPLVYVAVALVAGLLQTSTSGGSWLVRQALDLFTALVLEAPALLLGTAAACLVAGCRALSARTRRAEQQEDPSAATSV